MTGKEFDELLNLRLLKIKDVLSSKGAEYSIDKDRLHNFKRAAAIRGCTPAQALEGMWVKHLVSVQDLIRENAAGNHAVVLRLRDEKIGDAINYLILLEAILLDEAQPRPTV